MTARRTRPRRGALRGPDEVTDLATGILASMVSRTGHVVRLQILVALRYQRSSPVMLVNRIEQSLGTISYHFRVLRDAKLIHLVDEQRVRGAVEHVYALTKQGRALADDVAAVALAIEQLDPDVAFAALEADDEARRAVRAAKEPVAA